MSLVLRITTVDRKMSTTCGGCNALSCLPYDVFDADLGVRVSREKAGINSDRNGQRQQSVRCTGRHNQITV